MSIEAMKEALEALALFASDESDDGQMAISAYESLRQAIAESEKQEPVAVKHMMDWVYQLKRFSNDGRYMNIASGLSAGACYELAVEIEQFIKTAPVHAIDIPQECVDETAKHKHEWVEQPDLARVGEVGVWGHQREWVGLEEEEILKCFDSVALGQVEGDCVIDKHVNIFNAIRAIEDKLKEKNT